jgi:hypothetical protein
MTPDYPHKLFTDERCQYNLLMEVLAMDDKTSTKNSVVAY